MWEAVTFDKAVAEEFNFWEFAIMGLEILRGGDGAKSSKSPSSKLRLLRFLDLNSDCGAVFRSISRTDCLACSIECLFWIKAPISAKKEFFGDDTLLAQKSSHHKHVEALSTTCRRDRVARPRSSETPAAPEKFEEILIFGAI
jgi:hypothetical protein